MTWWHNHTLQWWQDGMKMLASQTLTRIVFFILLKSWVYLSSLYELSPVFIGQLPPGGPCPEGEVPLPLTNQRERCGHVTSCGPITAHLVGAHHVVTPPGQQPLQSVEGGEGAGPRQSSTLCRYICSQHKMLVQRYLLQCLYFCSWYCDIYLLQSTQTPRPRDILLFVTAPDSAFSWHTFQLTTYNYTLLRIKCQVCPESR